MKAVFIGADTQLIEMARLSLSLRWPGLVLVAASTADKGLDLIDQELPNVVFYHPVPDDMSLETTITALRGFSQVPLIVLARQKNDRDLVSALNLGADDYFETTCTVSELLARAAALLRRTSLGESGSVREDVMVSGELVMNPNTYEVHLRRQPVKLTRTEFQILRLLMENRGAVVNHKTLKYALWRDEDWDNGLLKKHVGRLRRKLGDNGRNPRWIATVTLVGYRFVGPTPLRLDPDNLVLTYLRNGDHDLVGEDLRDA